MLYFIKLYIDITTSMSLALSIYTTYAISKWSAIFNYFAFSIVWGSCCSCVWDFYCSTYKDLCITINTNNLLQQWIFQFHLTIGVIHSMCIILTQLFVVSLDSWFSALPNKTIIFLIFKIKNSVEFSLIIFVAAN